MDGSAAGMPLFSLRSGFPGYCRLLPASAARYQPLRPEMIPEAGEDPAPFGIRWFREFLCAARASVTRDLK